MIGYSSSHEELLGRPTWQRSVGQTEVLIWTRSMHATSLDLFTIPSMRDNFSLPSSLIKDLLFMHQARRKAYRYSIFSVGHRSSVIQILLMSHDAKILLDLFSIFTERGFTTRAVDGNTLGSLRDAVLGKFARKHETSGGLDLAWQKSGLFVGGGKLSSLCGNAFKDIVDEQVHTSSWWTIKTWKCSTLHSLRDAVLGEFARNHETNGGLDLAWRKSGLFVVGGKLSSSLGSNTFKDVIDERVHIGTPECLINMFHGRHTYSYFRLVQRKWTSIT
jgi:hypothetical protein